MAREIASSKAVGGSAAVSAPGGSKGSGAPVASWRNTFSSLAHRDFLLFWLGMLGIMAGMQMQMLARSYLTYDLTGSAVLLGVVNAGNALPMLFLSLFGGALADRFDRKRIIQVGQFLFAVLSLVMGIAIIMDVITWQYLLIGAVIQGATFSFLMPARQAIIPNLVPPEKITNAMALSSAAMSAMTLSAPAFAGGLYAFTGAHNVYFVMAFLGFAAVVLTSFIPKAGSGPSKRKGPMMKDIGAGLVYIKQNNLILVLLVMGLSTTVLAMPFRFLLPVFVVDVYRLGVDSMGLLVAVMGGASLVSALLVASLSTWKRGMLLIFSSFMSAIALMLVASIPIYFVAMFVMIPLGIGDAGRRTLNQSLVMEKVEDQYRGRVMSVFMLNRGLIPLGVLPTALLIDFLGPQIGIGILGFCLFAFTAYLYLTKKELREIQ